MAQDGENGFFRRRERGFHVGAAELQQSVALEEMPGDAGAKGDRALEAVPRYSPGGGFRRSGGANREGVGIQPEKHPGIFLRPELPNQSRAEARRGFPWA